MIVTVTCQIGTHVVGIRTYLLSLAFFTLQVLDSNNNLVVKRAQFRTKMYFPNYYEFLGTR